MTWPDGSKGPKTFWIDHPTRQQGLLEVRCLPASIAEDLAEAIERHKGEFYDPAVRPRTEVEAADQALYAALAHYRSQTSTPIDPNQEEDR